MPVHTCMFVFGKLVVQAVDHASIYPPENMVAFLYVEPKVFSALEACVDE
jgi:hypothetical protein